MFLPRGGLTSALVKWWSEGVSRHVILPPARRELGEQWFLLNGFNHQAEAHRVMHWDWNQPLLCLQPSEENVGKITFLFDGMISELLLLTIIRKLWFFFWLSFWMALISAYLCVYGQSHPRLKKSFDPERNPPTHSGSSCFSVGKTCHAMSVMPMLWRMFKTSL